MTQYQRSLFELAEAGSDAAVEVLGQFFTGDEDRQEFFRNRLQVSLTERRLVDTAGSPVGEVAAMVDLSDPPYYTASPNPFLSEFVAHYGMPVEPGDIYDVEAHRGEFVISKRHPVYAFHPYHTKVPPEAIRTLIEHYTSPGDLVLDGFAGSGMTGVAARECGRNAVLIDLSPVATFVAGVNCVSHDWRRAEATLRTILEESETKWGYLYRTAEDGQELGVNYFVWSDVFTCPECTEEFPFFPHGVIHHGTKVETRAAFPCPSCDSELNVRRANRVVEGGTKKKTLVWVNAGTGKRRTNREPTPRDLALASDVEDTLPAAWYPTDAIDPSGYSAKLAQLGDKTISDVSRILSRRNLIIFADLWERVSRVPDASLRHLCRATLTSVFTVISERQGYFGGGGGMSGNLYMPIVRMEKNPYDVLRRKVAKLTASESAKADADGVAVVSTQSATDLHRIPDNSIDYVYTDPPFGANIIYSEMNLALESWLKVKTEPEPEAVIDPSRDRTGDDYFDLMKTCFSEYYRVLKPGRWMTVEFHNTAAEVWNIIQNAIREAGFDIQQIGVLDKGTTTILSDIRPGAAKHDLLISAQKPGVAARDARQQELSVLDVWSFVAERLKSVSTVTDRKPEFLFGRMVAYHVERGFDVPISAAEFYRGLSERFAVRDGHYYLESDLHDQTALIADETLGGHQTSLYDRS